MSPRAIVWLIIAIAVIVVLVLTAMQALRAAREAQRLKRRVKEFQKLPLLAALATFEQDASRLRTTTTRAEPLVARALVAIAVIRRGPVPPEVVAAYRRARTALSALGRLRAG
ncbi:MAG TPA: hypothetical protein VE591_13640 [Candidatus Acidoferrum sp.]|nr:hypothetical protein [Candidatus Acidoferrum sp.]